MIGDPNSGDRTSSRWFNTAAFAPQALYTWGNEGSNVINGPGTWNVDVWIARLQFRLETFDTTNTTLGSTTFGQITSLNGNRQSQALKIIF
jgi:hypothetical protein